MQYDEEEFLYPEVDTAACVNCGIYEKVYSQLSERAEKRTEKENGESVLHRLPEQERAGSQNQHKRLDIWSVGRANNFFRWCCVGSWV